MEAADAGWGEFGKTPETQKVSSRERVIIDDVNPPGSSPGTARGRSKGDAPDIDGSVHPEPPGRCGWARLRR